PDFTLRDHDGNLHALSDHRGEKVVLLTWAPFCGCRFDLPGWQALYEELQSEGFTVLAVAEDAGGAETAGPWIRPTSFEEQYPQPVLDLMGWDAETWARAAAPAYPCLIDQRHEVARRYGMVNVPGPGGGPLPAGRDALPAQGPRRRPGALRRGGPAVAGELGLPAPGPPAGRSGHGRRARCRAGVLEVGRGPGGRELLPGGRAARH